MKFMFILLLLASASAELQRQEQQNKQHLDPTNDSETLDDIKQQMKRTLIGIGPYTYAANHGAAKHVGIHPLGFKYLLGYGPVGYVPFGKTAVTVLKPVLHPHGWKQIVPVQTVPVVRPLHVKPVLPIIPVHTKPHIITPVQHIDKPVFQPVLPQTPTLVKPVVQGTVPFVYPFYKQLVPIQPSALPIQPPTLPIQSPSLPIQPHVLQTVVPQFHLQPPFLHPQSPVVQPLTPAVYPQLPVQHPVIPHQFNPQQIVPQLFHFFKHLPQGPFFKQITPLIPVHYPQHPVPELPKVPIHTPVTTHDTGVSVQIPSHLPDHPHFRPTVHVVPQQPTPDFDEQGGQGQTQFGVVPQQPDFGTGQQGESETPFIFQQPIPTHPAPQTPLYLPPHPVFRPGVANPVGPAEATNSVQTELSATFPRHPFVGGIHHPSISLEPPYGPANHVG